MEQVDSEECFLKNCLHPEYTPQTVDWQLESNFYLYLSAFSVTETFGLHRIFNCFLGLNET